MKYKIIGIFLLIFLATTCSCSKDVDVKTLEGSIKSKVKKDGPHLAHLEAIYHILFVNEHKNLIASDDYYIRRDRASVYYGYEIEKAAIQVAQKNSIKILQVVLPVPKKISIDKRVLYQGYTHSKYNPVDEDGNEIDVDREITKKLVDVRNKYDKKSIELTKQISRQYFESIAKLYNLKLNLKFNG